MDKDIYEIKYVKEFLKEVVHPIWFKNGKLKAHRPINYEITRIKEDGKRSYNFVLDFSKSLHKDNFTENLSFKVTTRMFISNEYDFSKEWQAFQKSKENVQTTW